ncbi:M3 family metallopeptidase [Lachnospiraceae bacterium 62-35]
MDRKKRWYTQVWNQCLAWTAVLALISVGTAQASVEIPADGWYEPKYHADINYEDMEYEGFDSAELEEALDKLEEIFQEEEAGQEEEIEILYDKVLEEVDWLSTQYQLNNLIYYRDVQNEEAQEESLKLDAIENQILDRICLVLSQGIHSSYGNFLEGMIGENGVEELIDYHPMTEWEFELEEMDSSLIQEYDQAMMDSYTVIVDGKEWTTESYEESPPLNWGKSFEIYTALAKEKNSVIGEIFREMIQVRNEIAQIRGYENYADYAYAEIYKRDFSTEEIKSVYQAVKENIIPLYEEVQRVQFQADIEALQEAAEGVSGEDILNEIEPFIGKVHPDLTEAFAYMRAHHLYDIEEDDKKMEVAFTTDLPTYGAPFIFSGPYGDYGDYKTIVHEFGHYNQMFHCNEPALWQTARMDVYEIHSQGLEALFYPYAEELFGEGGQAFRYETINSMLYGIREGCLYDEFQNEVYKNPDMTLEEINKTFFRISREYGYYYQEEADQAYDWIRVHHTFESPMYYIGYATSALSSLDIWMESLEDREAAVNKYMHLSALGGSKPYRQVIEECGLQDIFEEGVISGISDAVREIVDQEPEPVGNKDRQKAVYMILIIGAVFLIWAAAVMVTIIILLIRKPGGNNRKRE